MMRTLRREAAPVFIRGGAAIGLVLGFVIAWNHPLHLTCTTHGADSISRCSTHSMAAIAEHWGIAIGTGLVLGGAAGLALAVMLGLEVRRRSA